jgi:hypothetical protein
MFQIQTNWITLKQLLSIVNIGEVVGDNSYGIQTQTQATQATQAVLSDDNTRWNSSSNTALQNG